jgi:S1-C subfamily serine protease
MRETVRLWVLLLVVASPAFAQVETAKVTIRAILVDKDLNQKPIPRLSLSLTRSDVAGTEPYAARTNFDGVAELQLPAGRYHLSTSEPVEFQGKKYSWEIDLTVAAPGTTVELSNDNAKSTDAPAEKPTRVVDDLAQLFKKYQNSVVTVWSEIGHGTGFVVDPEGLILTNQHVIGPSELISVQFDPKRKVEAKLVAFDAERDIAVLWANLAPFPDAIVAPLAKSKPEESPVLEGERVFTIGSPLHQQKILTTGIVSKVEPRAILSDININPGNSGGPLFSSLGIVVGLTTFGEQEASGPGISGIVRIEQAEQLLERAKTKMRDISPPLPALLPVEPSGTYPIDALKTSLQKAKFDERPYTFGEGNYDVAIVTPVLKYHYAEGARVQAQKEKESAQRKALTQ